MVWTSVFATRLEIEHQYVPTSPDPKVNKETDALCLSNAIEAAGNTVEALRAANREVREGYGVNSQTYKLYRQMTAGQAKKRDKKPRPKDDRRGAAQPSACSPPWPPCPR